jgi:hypothetical protein
MCGGKTWDNIISVGLTAAIAAAGKVFARMLPILPSVLQCPITSVPQPLAYYNQITIRHWCLIPTYSERRSTMVLILYLAVSSSRSAVDASSSRPDRNRMPSLIYLCTRVDEWACSFQLVSPRTSKYRLISSPHLTVQLAPTSRKFTIFSKEYDSTCKLCLLNPFSSDFGTDSSWKAASSSFGWGILGVSGGTLMFVVWWLAMIQDRKGKKDVEKQSSLRLPKIYMWADMENALTVNANFVQCNKISYSFPPWSKASMPQTHVRDSHEKTRRNNL